MANDYYDILGITKEELQALADQYGIERLALFGSYARGEQDQESDVDLLIRWGPGSRNLSRVFGFKNDVECRIGKSIDIVSEDYVYEGLKSSIFNEAQELL